MTAKPGQAYPVVTLDTMVTQKNQTTFRPMGKNGYFSRIQFTFFDVPILMKDEQQLLTEIRKGNERALDELYVTNKARFLRYGKHILDDNMVLEDIYQDAIIAFYENVRTGKVTELKSAISTYIISIGKFMLYRYLRNSRPTTSLETGDLQEIDWVISNYIENVTDEDETVSLLQNAIKKLGEPCSTILRMFYYDDKEPTAIMKLLGYANTDVVKSQKYRCMQSLKLIVKKIYRNAGKI
ncbi:RNA polymerase sigma factor [Parapedobacter pyrenivorans]|nr:sigma-70 family RNA polymerase sigma factor [Parapedobacter pyrenivorans]